jgi:hypothetical protein
MRDALEVQVLAQSFDGTTARVLSMLHAILFK